MRHADAVAASNLEQLTPSPSETPQTATGGGVGRTRPGSHVASQPRHVRLLWDAQWWWGEPVLQGRALVRLGCAATWFVLAVAAGRPVWPVLVLLPASALSFAHALRTPVLLWGERLGQRAQRILRWLLPYPEVPHYDDPPGWSEALGLSLVVYCTGVGRWFTDEPAAEAAAVIVVGIAVLSFVQNLVAHINWEMGQGQSGLYWLRPGLGVAFGLAFALLLAVPTDDRVVRSTAVSGGVVIVVSAMFSMLMTRRQAAVGARLVDLHTELVREADAALVHARLKNQARLVLDGLGLVEQGDKEALERVRRLCQTVAVVEDRLARNRTASTPAADLRRIVDMANWPDGPLTVEDRLGDRQLAGPDTDLLFTVAADLLTNAYQARADHILATFELDVTHGSEWIRFTLTCACGREIIDVEPGGSLMRLADLVVDRQGEFDAVEHGGGRHTFTARWPLTQ